MLLCQWIDELEIENKKLNGAVSVLNIIDLIFKLDDVVAKLCKFLFIICRSRFKMLSTLIT